MLEIKPTATRFVDIYHTIWDLKWAIQFPEVITSKNGVTMMWQTIKPEWAQISENSWQYLWRTSSEYIDEQMSLIQKDPSGKIIRHNFSIGLVLNATIHCIEDGIKMELNITNESSETFFKVGSDGGCFQARSPEFQNQNEVDRSYIYTNDKLIKMSETARTIPIRSTYHTDLKEYEKESTKKFEWFWGRSTTTVEKPVIVGAVSYNESKAVAIGYENSVSASQNADDHHCLHSQPFFGDISPKASVTKTGYILFGENLTDLMQKLKTQLK